MYDWSIRYAAVTIYASLCLCLRRILCQKAPTRAREFLFHSIDSRKCRGDGANRIRSYPQNVGIISAVSTSCRVVKGQLVEGLV